MAPLPALSFIFLLLFLCASSTPLLTQKTHIEQELLEEQPIPKPIQKNSKIQTKPKKSNSTSIPNLNQTKSIEPKKSNSTFIPNLNQTKSIKPKKLNSTSTSKLPKLNKTLTVKPTNSTKFAKSPLKASNSTKPTKAIKPTQLKLQKLIPKQAKNPKPVKLDPIWLDDPDSDSDLDSDLIAEFQYLPTQLHQALLPDLKKLSITSKAYIYKAHKNIAQNVKPFVGKTFAPKVALTASCIFVILTLCLVTALLYRLNSYLSFHLFLIFVQAYLAIYFFTLSVTAVVTGLEPLRFFYATSPSWYAWTQTVQTLGYLLYLLLQLIHLVVMFSAGENKAAVTKMLGLTQMIVGLVVGCHYYAAVFHRAVAGEPPRADWKVHGFYAVCFFAICLLARAEQQKKVYNGGEDGKKS